LLLEPASPGALADSRRAEQPPLGTMATPATTRDKALTALYIALWFIANGVLGVVAVAVGGESNRCRIGTLWGGTVGGGVERLVERRWKPRTGWHTTK